MKTKAIAIISGLLVAINSYGQIIQGGGGSGTGGLTSNQVAEIVLDLASSPTNGMTGDAVTNAINGTLVTSNYPSLIKIEGQLSTNFAKRMQIGSFVLSNFLAMGITNIIAGSNTVIYTNNGMLVINSSGSSNSSGGVTMEQVITNRLRFIPSRTKWLHFGDSLSDSVNEWFNLLTNGYISEWKGLSEAFNYAHSGDYITTQEAIFYDVLATNAPGTGTNGLVSIFVGANFNAGPTPLNTWIAKYSNMLWTAQASNCAVMAFTVPYHGDPDTDEWAVTNYFQFADWMIRKAPLWFTNYYLVDTLSLLGSNPYDTNAATFAPFNTDNLHFSSYGQQRIAREVDRVLRLGPMTAIGDSIAYRWRQEWTNSVMRNPVGQIIGKIQGNTITIGGSTVSDSTNLAIMAVGALVAGSIELTNNATYLNTESYPVGQNTNFWVDFTYAERQITATNNVHFLAVTNRPPVGKVMYKTIAVKTYSFTPIISFDTSFFLKGTNNFNAATNNVYLISFRDDGTNTVASITQ